MNSCLERPLPWRALSRKFARRCMKVQSKDLLAAADTLGVRLHILHASSESDLEAAFES